MEFKLREHFISVSPVSMECKVVRCGNTMKATIIHIQFQKDTTFVEAMRKINNVADLENDIYTMIADRQKDL